MNSTDTLVDDFLNLGLFILSDQEITQLYNVVDKRFYRTLPRAGKVVKEDELEKKVEFGKLMKRIREAEGY